MRASPLRLLAAASAAASVAAAAAPPATAAPAAPPPPLRNNNGLNRVPLMGWNTWCTDGRCERDWCNEDEVKSVADALTASGLFAAGYRHVALDDCWGYPNRTVDGQLQPDPARFPSGMLELTRWLHARNFTFGIYTSLGHTTCSMAEHTAHLPGSWGHVACVARPGWGGARSRGYGVVRAREGVGWCALARVGPSTNPAAVAGGQAAWVAAGARDEW